MGLAFDTIRSTGDETPPLGEMPLAPEGLTGRPQCELAHDMVEHLRTERPASGAAALRALRSAFPGASLSARVAALAAMIRP